MMTFCISNGILVVGQKMREDVTNETIVMNNLLMISSLFAIIVTVDSFDLTFPFGTNMTKCQIVSFPFKSIRTFAVFLVNNKSSC